MMMYLRAIALTGLSMGLSLGLSGRAPSPRATSALLGSPTGDNILTRDLLSLDSIRASLVRQEDTIIFALIERAQFRVNHKIYERDEVALPYPDISLFDYMFVETEKLHASVRRYASPEEHPFYLKSASLHAAQGLLPPLEYPTLLAANDINVNDHIMAYYQSSLVQTICLAGDDEQYGSSVLMDINALQAISRRIHLGKFVAESKFRDDPKTYTNLVEADDAQGVLDLLTNSAVEERLLERARRKAAAYGAGDPEQVTDGTVPGNYKVDPDYIAAVYRDFIIPLTKDVEVQYLYQRVGKAAPSLICFDAQA